MNASSMCECLQTSIAWQHSIRAALSIQIPMDSFVSDSLVTVAFLPAHGAPHIRTYPSMCPSLPQLKLL